jgi:hypothetical protein
VIAIASRSARRCTTLILCIVAVLERAGDAAAKACDAVVVELLKIADSLKLS